MADVNLIGIGYRHVRGGEVEFDKAGATIRQSANSTKKAASESNSILAAMGKHLAGMVAPARLAAVAIGAVTSAVIALGAGLALGVQQASSFESSFVRMNTLVGVGAATTNKWRGEVRSMASEVGIASTEMAQGLGAVLSAAGETASTMDVLRVSGKASAIGLGEVKDVAKFVSAALQAYGEDNLSAARAGDILLATVRAGALEANELAPVFGRVAGTAAALGIELEDAGSFLAVFSKLGVDTSETITALRGTMQALLTPTKAQSDALATLKGTAYDAMSTMEGLRQVVREKGLTVTLLELAKAFHGNADMIGAVIPESRALAGVLGITGAQAATAQEVVDELTNSVGILDQAHKDALSKDPVAMYRQLASSGKDAALAIGVELLPSIQGLVKALQALAANKEGVALVGDLVGFLVTLSSVSVGQQVQALNGIGAAVSWIGEKWQSAKAGFMDYFDAIGRFRASGGAVAGTVPELEGLGDYTYNQGNVTGPPEPPPVTTPPLTEEQKNELKHYQQLREELISTTAANRDLAAAHAEGAEAVAATTQRLEVERRVHQQTKDMTDEHRQALRALIVAQVESERRESGAATLADLDRQRTATLALADAQKRGAAATAEQAMKNKIAEAQHVATANAAKGQVAQIKATVEANELLNRSTDYEAKLQQQREETEGLRNLADAYALGAAAVVQANAEMAAEAELRQALTGLISTEVGAIAAEVTARALLRAEIAASGQAAALEEELRNMQDLAAIKRDDFHTERAYRQALADVNTEHRVRAELLKVEAERQAALAAITAQAKQDPSFTPAMEAAAVAAVNAQYDDYAVRVEGAIRAQGKLATEMEKTEATAKTTQQVFSELGGAIQGAFSGVEGPIGRAGQAIGVMVEQLAAAKDNTDRFAAAATAVAAIWDALGLGKEVTAGGFGGSGEGNYAAEGQAIGAVIGAIIGAFYGAPEVGAAIGSAAGGILGSLVGKGADQALGYIELRTGQLETTIIQSEHKLGMVIGELGKGIQSAVSEVLNAIGGALLDVPNISVKVRDGVIKVVVGTVSGWFKDMGDAVSFAVAEILKQGTITGISDTIRTILSQTDATDLDLLGKQLDFGKWYDSLRLGEAGTKIADAMAEFREKWNYAVQFGLDTAPIGQWFAQQMSSIKNAMLGVNEAGAKALAALASWSSGIDGTSDAATQGLAATQAALDAILAQIAQMEAEGAPRGNSHDDISGGYGAGGYGGAPGPDGMGHSQAPTGQSDQSAPTNEGMEWATLLADLKNKIPELRAAIDGYLAQLSAIPAKLTKEERDLGIWTALEHYLDGTKGYAEMAHKFAVMRAQIELNLIKLEIQKMDLSLDLWNEWAGIWQQAWNLTLDPNFGKPGKGGGMGGGNKGPSALQQAIQDSKDQIAMAAMGEFQRQVDSTNDKWDDLIKEAGLHSDAMAKATKQHNDAIKAANGNAEAIKAANEAYERAIRNIGATTEQIAAANEQREKELQLLRDQIHARVDRAINPQNEWQTQAEGIQKAYDDIRKANQALREAGVKGVDPKWKVNAAERAEMAALTEKAIDSLGLPMEGLRDRVKGMGDALAFVKAQADAGIISQERYGEVLAQVQRQAGQEVMGLAADLLEQMGNTDEAAALRRTMQIAEFELQRAQLNFLFEQYRLMGLLSPAVEAALTHALGIINEFDPNNLPMPGTTGRGPVFHGYEDAPTVNDAASQQADADASRRQEILDQITAWNQLGDPEATRELRDLAATFRAMRTDAVRLGMDVAALEGAYGTAVQDFWDQTLSPFEEQGRTLNEQLALLNEQFDDLRAAAIEFGGDVARIEAARQAEILRFWDDVLQPIRDFQAELEGGTLSALSPEQKLLAARARYEETAQRALAGDAEAIRSLPQLIQTYLTEAQGYLGTGPAYQAIYTSIQGVLAQILALAPAAATGAPAAAEGPSNILPFPTPPSGFSAGDGGYVSLPNRDRDARLDRLTATLEESASGHAVARESDARLRGLLEEALTNQAALEDRVDDLVNVVERLAGLVESQERRLAVNQ